MVVLFKYAIVNMAVLIVNRNIKMIEMLIVMTIINRKNKKQ